MDLFSRFIPIDRRLELAGGPGLPARAEGAVLFADLSGFTRLTEVFATAFGPQQGAEAIAAILNTVFDALIGAVHGYGGSVVGFAGDALTAWFADGPAPAGAVRATTAALAMQQAMGRLGAIPSPEGSLVLALKVVVAAGPVQRFVAGDPTIQRFDIVAGPAVMVLAATESLAETGEVVLDMATAQSLAGRVAIGAWRRDSTTGARGAVITAIRTDAAPAPRPAPPSADAAAVLDPAVLRSWVLPVVWERMQHGAGAFLSELRPAVALFLHFEGIDYAHPDAPAQLDAYVRRVQGVLARYEAALLQVTVAEKGSYLYAAFGAPLAHIDDAARAASAALSLRTPPPECPTIRNIRMGLSSGQVWTGAYGGRDSGTYGVLGDAVNLAAHLMEQAPPGSILATNPVRQAAGPGFRWRSLPASRVKGKTEPVVVYELAGAGPTAAAIHQEQGPRGTFVGRTAELMRIGARAARARFGHGQIVGISGEPGMGKSRLLEESLRTRESRRFVAYEGAAQSYGRQTSYLAWQPIWTAFCGLHPTDGTEIEREQVAGCLRALDPALLPRLPLLGPVLGLAIPDTPLTAGMDEKLRKTSREGMLVHLLRVRAATTPLILIIEDAQWLDPLSQDLLAAVARAIAGDPILILLTYRRAEADSAAILAPLAQLAHFTEIPLPPLEPLEAAALVAARLGQTNVAALPAALMEALIRRAEGNPFYLEELLNYLVERGIDPLQAPTLADLEWPASLHSLLLARLDQLTERQRTVLKIASIVGRRFLVAELCGVHPEIGAEADVRADLVALDRLDITLRDESATEGAYLFKHLLTQEVTYASLPGRLRADLHARFAGWLEVQSGAADETLPLDMLAFHYGQSQNTAKQREYYRKAGDAAAAVYANAAAINYYERLLPLLSAPERGPVLLALAAIQGRTGAWDAAATCYQEIWEYEEGKRSADNAAPAPNPQVQAEAALGLARVRRSQAAYDEALTWFAAAETLFAQAGDARGQARVLTERGLVYWRRADYATARTVLEAAVASSRASGDLITQARAQEQLGVIAYLHGEYGVARALTEEALALRRARSDRPGIAVTLGNLGNVLFEQGEYRQAREFYEECLALDRELGGRKGIADDLSNLGGVLLVQGDNAPARGMHEESLALRRELGDRWGVTISLGNLATVLLNEGDREGAATYFQESLTLSQELDDQVGVAGAFHGLGQVAQGRGDYERAQRLYSESLVLARTLGNRQAISIALGALGALALARNAPTEAADYFRQSMAEADAIGAQRDSALGLAGLAAVAAKQGQAERAARLLGAGAALLATLGAVPDHPARLLAEQTTAIVQAALGGPDYERAHAAGAALPPTTAVAEALAE